MRAVNLNDVEAGRDGAHRRVGKGLDQAADLLDGELPRRGPALGVGDGARPHDVGGPAAVRLVGDDLARGAGDPRRQGARLAAGVGDLDGGLDALAVGKVDDAAQGRDVGVGPDAGVLRGDAAASLDGRGLDDDEPRAAEGVLAQVHQVVVGQVAVVGRVLAHGADDPAVGQLDGAHPQRLVERRRGGRGRVRGGARGGFLRGRVEGHAGLALVAEVEAAHGGGGVWWWWWRWW